MVEEKDRHVVVVDGSNLATEGRKMPSLQQLDEAVRAFAAENPDVEIVVVVDATFEHRIDRSERAKLTEAELHGEVVSPPAGAIGRGDAFVLRIAERTGARVLSNDSFQEFHAQHPWLFDEGRLLGGKPVPGVGWIFTPRRPVRGPTSKEVVGKARRAAAEAALSPPRKAAELAKAARKAEKHAAGKDSAATGGAAPKIGDVRRPGEAETGASNGRKTPPDGAAEQPAPEGEPGEERPATTTRAKTSAAKKTATKKTATKKTATKKATAEKAATKKAAAGKAVSKDEGEKEDPGAKAAAKKSPSAKDAAVATDATSAQPAKKTAAKKTAAKKTAAKKTAAATKATTKKAATKKTAATKAGAKKTAATKKATAKNATGKSSEEAAPAAEEPAAPAAPGAPAGRSGRASGRDDPVVRRAIDDAIAEVVTSSDDMSDGKGEKKAARGHGGGKKSERAEEPQGKKRSRGRSTPRPAVNEPLAFITFVAAYPLAAELEGEVAAFTSHGAMVDVALPDGGVLHCYIPLSGMGDPPPVKARQVLSRGERRSFVLVGLDPIRRVAELALPGTPSSPSTSELPDSERASSASR